MKYSPTQRAAIDDLARFGVLERRRSAAGPMVFTAPGAGEHAPKTIRVLLRHGLARTWSPCKRRVRVALRAPIRALVVHRPHAARLP